jgi:hypothetical protein
MNKSADVFYRLSIATVLFSLANGLFGFVSGYSGGVLTILMAVVALIFFKIAESFNK